MKTPIANALLFLVPYFVMMPAVSWLIGSDTLFPQRYVVPGLAMAVGIYLGYRWALEEAARDSARNLEQGKTS